MTKIDSVCHRSPLHGWVGPDRYGLSARELCWPGRFRSLPMSGCLQNQGFPGSFRRLFCEPGGEQHVLGYEFPHAARSLFQLLPFRRATLPERLLKKFPHRGGDLFQVCFEREMPGLQELNGRVRIVSQESLGARRNEIWIKFTPDG
jgi:hypothetical protein